MAGPAMKFLESPLMSAFIAYMMSNWSRRSRVDQSRHRLRHLVEMVRTVADDAEAAAVAGSARRFLAGLRDLFGRNNEIDRLEEAVEELERLTAPGGALDKLYSVFWHRDITARATAMDVDVVDGPPAVGARHGSESVVAGAGLAVPGAKRKRVCSSGVDPRGSTWVDTVEKRQKRHVMLQPWTRRHTVGFGAPRDPVPLPQPANSVEDRARTLALAMARVRCRIGRPTRRRRHAILGQHFSMFSLQ